MSKVKIYKPKCQGCEHYLLYAESVPKKMAGILLKNGFRYCTGGKRIRQFKSSDPKVYLPSWCPRRKSPAELRIYCFKDTQTEWMRMLLKSDGVKAAPCGYQYAVRHAGHTPLSAAEFIEQTSERQIKDILDTPVRVDEIIEIDDGIKPYYFHLTDITAVEVIYFDGDKARQNTLQANESH